MNFYASDEWPEHCEIQTGCTEPARKECGNCGAITCEKHGEEHRRDAYWPKLPPAIGRKPMWVCEDCIRADLDE